MRIVVTSDFHGSHPDDVPPCDLLIVAGDVIGRAPALLGRWLNRQPAETIVGIAGNHDFIAEENPDAMRELPWIYLQDEGVVVDGVRIWGTPWAVKFGSWAFMLPDDELAEKWARIPDDTEILVSHGPAHNVHDKVFRDDHVGSKTLRKKIDQLDDLQLLVTGHIHEAYGKGGFYRSTPSGPVWVSAVNASFVGWGKHQPPIVINY